MRRGISIVAVTMLLLPGAMTPTALAAKKPKPHVCPPGRFLVDAAAGPLLPGQSPAIDAVAYDANGVVSLDGCGAGAGARAKATRHATRLAAKWTACGTFTKVAVSGSIASPACETLVGRIKAKKLKTRRFTATRSACSDGRLDETGGEPCDTSAAGGDAACPGGCVACACVTTSTTMSTPSTTTSTTIAGACPVPPGFDGGTAQPVTSVTATITDLADAPLAGVPTAIVGTDLASAVVLTSAGGAVTVNGPGPQLHRPEFRFGDAVTTVRLAIPLTSATTSLGTLATAVLPPAGMALDPGTTATSGGLSVSIASGAAIAIDDLTYDTPEKQRLRAVALPVAKEAAVVTPSGLGLELLFGLAPAGTLVCPPATVTIPNAAGWPANADVEFFIQGSDVAQDWAPFGGWSKISDGVVSADGSTVSTTPGQGFPILEAVFGVRRRAG